VAKEEALEVDGVVTEILPGGRFRIQVDGLQEILAYTAGKMRKNRIRTMVGDRVTVEMTPYDLTRGRLVYRYKAESSGGPASVRRPVYRPRR